ncbi:MAG: ABC transporter permease [Chloroflexota bacterium]|nr:ABC transporter permease [Chloroflexota bacterium]MDE3192687.1 ABC transporter permease [Chloroflexota bacterium]
MIASARLLVVSSIFTYRALFSWLNPASYVAEKMLFPVVQMTFFALLGKYGAAQPLDFYLVGNALLVAYQATFTVANAVGDERWQGTLQYVVASPANRAIVFFGRGVGHALDGTLTIVVAFLIALLYGLDLSHANVAGLAAAIFVASFSATAFGLFLGAAAYLVLDANFLANLAMFVLLLLTGTNVPLSDLPPFLSPVSQILPLTRSVAAARMLATGGAFADAIPLIAQDVVIGALWGVAGLVLFGWLEVQARRRGTLEGF